ncbi:hypothetical protein EDB81DRAFT_921310 [Dactylonectria macrodidyma]|uniref:Uncharacterized protein n=1 Tax=Dactylonectria macrodidyma TaxID=307937 RepID=A0A9P9D821_9HYPO|nr:hypothetical protein EDB81DRAFT_921310 [Dactylonectria macrodidyma]
MSQASQNGPHESSSQQTAIAVPDDDDTNGRGHAASSTTPRQFMTPTVKTKSGSSGENPFVILDDDDGNAPNPAPSLTTPRRFMMPTVKTESGSSGANPFVILDNDDVNTPNPAPSLTTPRRSMTPTVKTESGSSSTHSLAVPDPTSTIRPKSPAGNSGLLNGRDRQTSTEQNRTGDGVAKDAAMSANTDSESLEQHGDTGELGTLVSLESKYAQATQSKVEFVCSAKERIAEIQAEMGGLAKEKKHLLQQIASLERKPAVKGKKKAMATDPSQQSADGWHGEQEPGTETTESLVTDPGSVSSAALPLSHDAVSTVLYTSQRKLL